MRSKMPYRRCKVETVNAETEVVHAVSVETCTEVEVESEVLVEVEVVDKTGST